MVRPQVSAPGASSGRSNKKSGGAGGKGRGALVALAWMVLTCLTCASVVYSIRIYSALVSTDEVNIDYVGGGGGGGGGGVRGGGGPASSPERSAERSARSVAEAEQEPNGGGDNKKEGKGPNEGEGGGGGGDGDEKKKEEDKKDEEEPKEEEEEPNYVLLYPNQECVGSPIRIPYSSEERNCQHCRDFCTLKFPDKDETANTIHYKSMYVVGDRGVQVMGVCLGQYTYDKYDTLAVLRPGEGCKNVSGAAHARFV